MPYRLSSQPPLKDRSSSLSRNPCIDARVERFRRRNLGQPKKNTDQKPQKRVVHEILKDIEAEVCQRVQKNKCIPQNRDGQWEQSRLTQRANGFPRGSQKSCSPEYPKNRP